MATKTSTKSKSKTSTKPSTNGAASKATIEKTLTESAKRAERTVNRRQTTKSVNTLESNLKVLDETVKMVNQQMWMLVYDIPSVKEDVCPSPCTTIKKYGFYLNLSCCVLPQKGLDSEEIQELIKLWNENGVENHLIPYADHAQKQILEIARRKLETEVRRIHTSVIKRIDNADRKLREAQEALEEEAKTKSDDLIGKKADYYIDRRDNNIRVAIKESAEALDAAIASAMLFDDTEHFEHLFTALRELLVSEAQSFNAYGMAKGLKGCKLAYVYGE